MTSNFARLGLVMALALAFVPACDDSGDGGAGGAADARASAFPDAAAIPDARPDAPPVAPTADGGGTGLLACSIEEVTPLFQCAFEECVDLPDPTMLPDGGVGLPSFDLAEFGTCAALSCGSELFGLSPGCQRCLLGAFAGGATGALDGCVSGGLPELPGGLPTPP